MLDSIKDIYQKQAAQLLFAVLAAKSNVPVTRFAHLPEMSTEFAVNLEYRPLNNDELSTSIEEAKSRMNACYIDGTNRRGWTQDI
jgi:hypothetical protein